MSFFVSFGAVAGVNTHISKPVSIGFDGGYRISSQHAYSDYGIDGSDVEGFGGEVFVDVSFIFRINDTFGIK